MTETFILSNKEFELLLRIATGKNSFILPYCAEVIKEEEADHLIRNMEQKGLLCRVEDHIAPDNILTAILRSMAAAQAVIAIKNGKTMIYFGTLIVLLSGYERREDGLKLKVYAGIDELSESEDVLEAINRKCICHFINADKTLRYKTLAAALKSKLFNGTEKRFSNREAFHDT